MGEMQTEIYANLEEDTQQDNFMIFMIGSVSYGIEMRYIKEIVGLQVITTLPEMPDYCKGIINLRGAIIPVLDVRRRFLMEPLDYNDRTCIIVIDLLGSAVGLIVDSVSEVLKIAENDISETPDFHNSLNNKYVKSIAKTESDVILLLACEALVIDGVADIVGEMTKC